MSQSRKKMPPLLPPKKRGKNDTFDFLRKSTTTTRPSTLNQPKPKNDSPSATALNNPSQGAGSSQPFIGPQSVAPIKPSNSSAHPPPPPRARAYRPTHRSPKAVAQAEPTRSAPPPQERTYLREKASSKPSSTATARPPRPVRPSHDDKTKNEPSKSATRPLLMNPNMFMAGKLAQEYLMKATLFGQPYVPTEADFPPAPSSPGSSHDGKTNEPSESDVDKEKEKKTNKGKAIELEANPEPKSNELDQQQRVNNLRYADVSKKLMSHGMHLPGVVNPSQLYEFLNRHPEVE